MTSNDLDKNVEYYPFYTLKNALPFLSLKLIWTHLP